MKKTVVVVLVLVVAQMLVAGGIVTNTNQSAQFIRTLSRNASTEIDAAYYNPAGLTALTNGFHVSLYNQSIFQEKKVTNSFGPLNNDEFIGEVNVPVFPNLYAAYKMDKLVVSFGFGPNGGGGTADFANGLPTFEMPLAAIPGMVSAMGIPTSGYQADIAFKGSSVFYGFQFNASYAVCDMLSAAIGARYISAVNGYEGGIKNIQINPTFPALGMNGNYMSAAQFFTALSQVNPAAGAYVQRVQDIAVEVDQTGTAITPIISLNAKPMDKLNVSLRYELNTALELTNETIKDQSGMFPNGAKTKADIPAIAALGVGYAVSPDLRAALSFTYFFDKNADWNGREELVDNNSFEISAGAEYDLSDALLVSAGVLRTQIGVNSDFQNDMSHNLSANTIGLGLRYTLAGAWAIDLGGLYSMYEESTRDGVSNGVAYTESYNRKNVAAVVGLGYHF